MARTAQIQRERARRAAAPKSEFPLPFSYTQYVPITLVELRMRHFSGKIRAKTNWWEKINDADIVAKWREEIIAHDRTVVDKYWSGQERLDHGGGSKKWPRDPITETQLDYIFAELRYDAAQRDPDTGIFALSVKKVHESRSLISPRLKRELLDGVARLEDVPDDQKDWHPRSGNQVLDLVHPSLYCLRIGESYVRTKDADRSVEHLEVITKEAYKARRPDLSNISQEDYWSVSNEYQWLPTDFQVSDTGEVKALSYINNLHPIQHKALYPTITSMLARFIPLFDCVLSDTLSAEPPLAIQVDPCEWYGDMANIDYDELEIDDIVEWRSEHLWPIIPDPAPFAPPPFRDRVEYRLNGHKIQVIVKLANIVLTPDNPKYWGGAWHVEGMRNESIVATGLYYYACDNITESRLDFRTLVGDRNSVMQLRYEQSDHQGYVVAYGFGRGDPLNQVLGHVVAEEDKCIAFPNIYHHHVDRFELADPTKPGYRKILCFFLVNPEREILSTSDVPPQQENWVMDEVEAAPVLQRFPRELFDMISGHIKESVISREEAEDHRDALMDERSNFVQHHNEQIYDMEFNMCEH